LTGHHDSLPARAPEAAPQLEGVLDEIISLLGLSHGDRRSELRDALRSQAEAYLLDRSIEPYWGRPGEQRDAFRKLLKSLYGTLDAMDRIAPEYAASLDGLLERDEKRDPNRESIFAHTRQANARLCELIERFDVEYHPKGGRATDLVLEETVRNLIGIIELITGKQPRVQKNKHNGKNPALKSPEARAIGRLLQCIDPSLNEVKIVHMIEKIRRQPRASEWHLDALFRLDPDAELNASLLGNRDGD
jgi:hypothetical protein